MSVELVKDILEYKKDIESINDLGDLVDSIKDKKVVMLGEASHGTHEYYNWRAKLSRLLIEEHGFDFIAVEGDWPPCYEVNRFIKHYKDTPSEATKVLKSFKRWPTWMWSNWETKELIEWLREYNTEKEPTDLAGFYGLDVYSLWESLDNVIEFLKNQDTDSKNIAQNALKCFEPYRDENGQLYTYATRVFPEGCSQEVNQILSEVRLNKPVYLKDREHSFSTEQNAIVAKNAEEYYREMAAGTKSTWNLRDSHMMETLNRLLNFYGPSSKAIVWAHNTHIGDARYTDMADNNLHNIGQLAREEIGAESVSLVGFGSYKGRVLAGSRWGAKVEEMTLPSAITGSWEELCHRAGSRFHLDMSRLATSKVLEQTIPHRAVGVVYNPNFERGNYVPTVIAKRYDHFLFFDQTKALHNIERDSTEHKIPDTFPFGV